MLDNPNCSDAFAETVAGPFVPEPPLAAVTLADFLARDFPPREMLVAPWLPRQGLAMIYAARGVGKTHLALAGAYAVATGGELLGWNAPAPRRVLLVDGEMPGAALQERLQRLVDEDRRAMGTPVAG